MSIWAQILPQLGLLSGTQCDCSVTAHKRGGKNSSVAGSDCSRTCATSSNNNVHTPVNTQKHAPKQQQQPQCRYADYTQARARKQPRTHSFHFRFTAGLILSFVRAHYYFFNSNNNPLLPLRLALPPLSSHKLLLSFVLPLSRYSTEINVGSWYTQSETVYIMHLYMHKHARGQSQFLINLPQFFPAQTVVLAPQMLIRWCCVCLSLSCSLFHSDHPHHTHTSTKTMNIHLHILWDHDEIFSEPTMPACVRVCEYGCLECWRVFLSCK